MREFRIGDITITDNSDAFVIAECGNTHNGSIETCKKLFVAAKESGCDAVKLQKKTIDECYTKALLNRPYDNRNSYGRTYGEHKRHLEFDRAAFDELKATAHYLGLYFICTAFDPPAADFCCSIGVDAIKIASGDLTNTPLINYVAKKGLPMIISTGGGTIQDINRANAIIGDRKAEAAFLHCVASYPNRPEEINLSAIKTMRHILSDRIIGYSCHYDGIEAAVLSYHFGARIIEKHFTLSRADKGTDHALSLNPQGMRKMVSYLRHGAKMSGTGEKRPLAAEVSALEKMRKCIHLKKPVISGEPIGIDAIKIASPATQGGIEPYMLNGVIGKIAICDLSTADDLTWDKLK